MCFYDAGHLPGFDVLGENAEEKWSRDTRGSGKGEVRDADGTVGVGCYEMVVEEAVSCFSSSSSFSKYRGQHISYLASPFHPFILGGTKW